MPHYAHAQCILIGPPPPLGPPPSANPLHLLDTSTQGNSNTRLCVQGAVPTRGGGGGGGGTNEVETCNGTPVLPTYRYKHARFIVVVATQSARRKYVVDLPTVVSRPSMGPVVTATTYTGTSTNNAGGTATNNAGGTAYATAQLSDQHYRTTPLKGKP